MLLNSDFNTFLKHFETNLADMLSPDKPGAFILVLANSLQDESLQKALEPQLARTFSALEQSYKQKILQAGDDDLQVFGALVKSGIGHYHAWEQKELYPWRASFNPFRALRPQRSSGDTFKTIKLAFDDQRFHFDKPFLKPEILSEESFNGQTIRVLYHKFPLLAYHLLILPDPQGHQPQFMTESTHLLAWELISHCSESIPGFGLAYNSLGASASVNHLHLHGFFQSEPFAIENKNWLHNGGNRAYPVHCYSMHSVNECWALIEKLQNDNQPFNLLFRPSVCYVMARPAQGLRILPEWLPDAGWYELSGGFNLLYHHHFIDITVEKIEAGLLNMRL